MTDSSAPVEKPNYKDSVFLPQTSFPMKAGLPVQEPKWLELWAELDLYNLLRQQNADKPKFVLHDGPPYANGDIHIGHALNKILKDVVVRSQSMLGRDAPYVPGWDCHGLPIEWKIEEKYRKAGKDKDEIPVLDFRNECRAFAAHWVDVQSAQFQRLGVIGDWSNPYKTMLFESEAAIAAEIHKFAMNGGLYRGVKPVMWSTVEKTALAEAEIEYHDHYSTAIHVSFPMVAAPNRPELVGAQVIIWTTTPWTIPANRAIAYGDFEYVLATVLGTSREGEVVSPNFKFAGQKFIIAKDLLESFSKLTDLIFRADSIGLTASDLEGALAAHPLRGKGYDFDVPLLFGEHVTTEAGTGFVHTAPSHGADDYQLGLKHNLEIPELVLADGRYADHVPLFAGHYVYKPDGKTGTANAEVIAALIEAGALVHQEKFKHSYPHSWRSKAPVIFRATPQWFISMQTNDLRKVALQAISDTTWIPAAGENRIRAMVETRPDWNISRQRTWGVPIAIFVNKQTNEVLRDEAVMERVRSAFDKHGADIWYSGDAQQFLGDKYKADDYEQIFDIVDVWFESGCTHAFVLEARGLPSPADLYLEGSDQHRGWFHSSLLESCGTRGRAPYKAVMTHGFTLDDKGRKMSKSVGNIIAPEKLIGEYGADILRLWALTSNYAEDNRIGADIIKQTAELYRRLRNTLRYILGGLDGFSESERIDAAQLPELERYILHLLAGIDRDIHADIEIYDFTSAINRLHTFCTNDLSAFYFDVRKDALYCDSMNSLRRRASRTMLDILYNYLTAWLAPFLCFTAEEAWQARGVTEATPSIHLAEFPPVPEAWVNDALVERWTLIRQVRGTITGALELARAGKEIGSSLQAAPMLYLTPEVHEHLKGVNFAEIAITSSLIVSTDQPPADAFRMDGADGVAVKVMLAEGSKCERCWQVLPEVGSHADHAYICDRCVEVVTHQLKDAA